MESYPRETAYVQSTTHPDPSPPSPHVPPGAGWKSQVKRRLPSLCLRPWRTLVGRGTGRGTGLCGVSDILLTPTEGLEILFSVISDKSKKSGSQELEDEVSALRVRSLRME